LIVSDASQKRPKRGHEENLMDPKSLRYASTHEWASLQGDICTIGITKFACEQLTDVVFIELPDVGDAVFDGDSFGEIESVKAVSDLYSPVNGEVIEVNNKLVEDPGQVAADPYGKGWMIKVKVEPGTKLDKLMTLEQYEKQIASEEH
jgi:glycine cleavage system H protein